MSIYLVCSDLVYYIPTSHFIAPQKELQWNLVIRRSLGPWKLPCYIRFLISGQRNIKSWDQQNYLVIRGFCYIGPLYNKVTLYIENVPYTVKSNKGQILAVYSENTTNSPFISDTGTLYLVVYTELKHWSLYKRNTFWILREGPKSLCILIWLPQGYIMRVQSFLWFQTFLLFTKPHFQTFNALKSTSFQVFQIISHFFQTFSHRCSHTPAVFSPDIKGRWRGGGGGGGDSDLSLFWSHTYIHVWRTLYFVLSVPRCDTLGRFTNLYSVILTAKRISKGRPSNLPVDAIFCISVVKIWKLSQLQNLRIKLFFGW